MQIENPRYGWGNLDVNGEIHTWMANPGCRWGAPCRCRTPYVDGETHMWMGSPRCRWGAPYVDGQPHMGMESLRYG